jgi:hypothetical protein
MDIARMNDSLESDLHDHQRPHLNARHLPIPQPHTHTRARNDQLALYEDGQEELSVAQLRAVRTVLRRLATPAEGQPDAEAVFKETVLKGSRLAFPRHVERKAEAEVNVGSVIPCAHTSCTGLDC